MPSPVGTQTVLRYPRISRHIVSERNSPRAHSLRIVAARLARLPLYARHAFRAPHREYPEKSDEVTLSALAIVKIFSRPEFKRLTGIDASPEGGRYFYFLWRNHGCFDEQLLFQNFVHFHSLYGAMAAICGSHGLFEDSLRFIDFMGVSMMYVLLDEVFLRKVHLGGGGFMDVLSMVKL